MNDKLSPWVRTSTGDLLSADGLWRVRKASRYCLVASGRTVQHYHLFHRGQRFTPTGREEDYVRFCTPLAARLYAEAQAGIIRAKEQA